MVDVAADAFGGGVVAGGYGVLEVGGVSVEVAVGDFLQGTVDVGVDWEGEADSACGDTVSGDGCVVVLQGGV